MRKIFLLLIILVSSIYGFSQTPFGVRIEPMAISGLGGLQAYAFGQSHGKWLIVGGRLDGLHRRQPWAAFDIAGHNNELIVVDPISLQKWSAPLSSLSVEMREQLSSTNMEFHQEGDFLYVVGGYGYSNTAQDHITYDNLTAIDVPSTINAIVNGTAFSAHFRQVSDSQFAITGGHLKKIYDTYYLVGGNKFDGRYNPMGHATYTQVYTNQLRKFKLDDDGTNLTITHLPSITDTAQFHRRDYNVIPQIMPNGEEGLTSFSGVFQIAVNAPFLNCTNIDSSGYVANSAFSQYYNHYHCANIPLYSANLNEMHNVFFGGIAQYYDSLGTLVQDNEVPFVKTIARVTRTANGTMTEYKLPVEMPDFLGAGSEFIEVEGIAKYANGVLKLDSLQADTTMVGYIFGGISSSAKNIFMTNNGNQSSASDQIFRVYIIKNNTTAIDAANVQSHSNLRMQMYPNPNDGILKIDFEISYRSDVILNLHDISGKLIRKEIYRKEALKIGKNYVELKLDVPQASGVFLISLESKRDKISQQLILN